MPPLQNGTEQAIISLKSTVDAVESLLTEINLVISEGDAVVPPYVSTLDKAERHLGTMYIFSPLPIVILTQRQQSHAGMKNTMEGIRRCVAGWVSD
jgi:methyl coenzyme M reductase subunit C-like uncharacterized protein (methanogenesis marker protein 7)